MCLLYTTHGRRTSAFASAESSSDVYFSVEASYKDMYMCILNLLYHHKISFHLAIYSINIASHRYEQGGTAGYAKNMDIYRQA